MTNCRPTYGCVTFRNVSQTPTRRRSHLRHSRRGFGVDVADIGTGPRHRQSGTPHSEPLRLTERFTRIDPEMVDYEIRVEDPRDGPDRAR